MLEPKAQNGTPLFPLHNELQSLNNAQTLWFTVRVTLLMIAVASTAALGLLHPEKLPVSTHIIGLIAFLSVSIYIIVEPEKRYIAFKEAYLSLRSDIGKYNMEQISSDELIDRWSRIDERLYSKILRC